MHNLSVPFSFAFAVPGTHGHSLGQESNLSHSNDNAESLTARLPENLPFLFFFFFLAAPPAYKNFPGQGSNPPHSSDLAPAVAVLDT